MNCTSCGTQILPGASFCAECGSKATVPFDGGQAEMLQAPAEVVMPSPAGSVQHASTSAPAGPSALPTSESKGFVNAKKGINDMFEGQRLLIAALIIPAVMALLSPLSFFLYPVFLIAAFTEPCLIVAGYVYKLVGYFRASRDEKLFLPALIAGLSMLGLAIALGVMALTIAIDGNHMTTISLMELVSAAGVVETVSTIALLVSDLFAYFGVVSLAHKVDAAKIVSSGRIFAIVTVAAFLLCMIISEPPVVAAAVSPWSFAPFISLALAVVPMVLQMVLFSRAKEMID